MLLRATFQGPLTKPSIFKVDDKTNLTITVIVLTFKNGVDLSGLYLNFLSKRYNCTVNKFVTVLISTFTKTVLIVKVVATFSTVIEDRAILLVVNLVMNCLTDDTVSLLGFFDATRNIGSCLV